MGGTLSGPSHHLSLSRVLFSIFYSNQGQPSPADEEQDRDVTIFSPLHISFMISIRNFTIQTIWSQGNKAPPPSPPRLVEYCNGKIKINSISKSPTNFFSREATLGLTLSVRTYIRTFVRNAISTFSSIKFLCF